MGATTPALSGKLLRVDGMTDDELRAWDRLGRSALEPNPFLEPALLRPAVHHYGSPDLRLAVATDGSAFHAAFPVVPMRSWGGLRHPAWVSPPPLKWAVQLATPLVSRARSDDALAAALGALASADGPGLLALEYVADDGAVASALRRAVRRMHAPMYVHRTWQRGTLRRSFHPATGDYLPGPYSRRELRKLRNGLAAVAGGDVAVVDRTDDPGAAERFLTMEAAGWKGHAPHGQACLVRPDRGEWFRAVFARMRGEGRLVVLCLEAGGQTVAMCCLLRSDDGAFGWRACYDERFRKYSPGTQLHVAAMQHFLENMDEASYDSSTDLENTYLLRTFPDRRTLASYLIGVGGLSDRSLVRVYPAFRAANSWSRDRRLSGRAPNRGAAPSPAAVRRPMSPGAAQPDVQHS